jgi:hypothetical protein
VDSAEAPISIASARTDRLGEDDLVDDWNLGDDGGRGLPRARESVSEDEGGFWAPGATRIKKVLASALIALAAIFVAWHVYELVVGFLRALS